MRRDLTRQSLNIAASVDILVHVLNVTRIDASGIHSVSGIEPEVAPRKAPRPNKPGYIIWYGIKA
jgi:hypothetical protein